jgi:hypothetical protein
MKTTFIYLLLIGFTLSACNKEPVAVDYGEVDGSNYVAIGTDATAGYADDALHYDSQINSLANILNDQLTLNGRFAFNQPLLDEAANGINLNGDAQLIMGYKTDCNDTVSLSPVRIATEGNLAAWNENTYATAPFNNLGVPGVSALDVTILISQE